MAGSGDIEEIRETTPLLPKPRKPSSASSTSITEGSLLTWSPPASWTTAISLASALINCLWAGSVLIFSLYAPLFNEHLGYRQMQINAVSVATEIGMYLPVPIFGFICDRYGPRRLSLLSGCFFGPGYALAAMTYARAWDYKIMVAAFALIGMGTSSMYFSGVTTCAKNFTGRRGLALALPIAAFGLSSLWQAQLVSRVFTVDGVLLADRVFSFFSVCLVGVAISGGIGLRVSACEDEEETESEVEEDEKEWVNSDTRAFLADRRMWTFAAGFFLVTGPGEAFINNMGTLIQTLRPSVSSTTGVDPALQVSLIALTSTVARLLAGSISDYLAPPAPTIHLPPHPPHPRSVSRMTILLLFTVLMFFGFFLVSTGLIHQRPPLFWLVSTTIGAGYGAVFCLAPTVVSVVWGTKNFGTNWGIITTTPALGAVVYGSIFAAEYDAEAEGGICYGWGCARWSFSAMTASLVAAVLGWGIVAARWRKGSVVV